jgi:hypothetical protein
MHDVVEGGEYHQHKDDSEPDPEPNLLGAV